MAKKLNWNPSIVHKKAKTKLNKLFLCKTKITFSKIAKISLVRALFCIPYLYFLSSAINRFISFVCYEDHIRVKQRKKLATGPPRTCEKRTKKYCATKLRTNYYSVLLSLYKSRLQLFLSRNKWIYLLRYQCNIDYIIYRRSDFPLFLDLFQLCLFEKYDLISRVKTSPQRLCYNKRNVANYSILCN